MESALLQVSTHPTSAHSEQLNVCHAIAINRISLPSSRCYAPPTRGVYCVGVGALQLRAIQSGWQSEKQRLQYESAVALSNSHNALLRAQCESAELSELHDEERRVMLESLQQLVVDNMSLKHQLHDANTQMQHMRSTAAAVNAVSPSPTPQGAVIAAAPVVATSPTSADAAAAAAAASSVAASAAAAASSELASLRSQAQLSAQTVQLLTSALTKIQAEKEELASECSALRRALEQEHRLRQALESTAAASAAAAAAVAPSPLVAPVAAIPSPMMPNLNTPARPVASQASPELALQPTGARVAVDEVEPRSAPVPNWTLQTAATPPSAGAAHSITPMSPLELHRQLSPLSTAAQPIMRAADVTQAADVQAAPVSPPAVAQSSLPASSSAPVDAAEAKSEAAAPLLAPVASSPLAKPLGAASVPVADNPSPTPSPESGERDFDLPAFHVSQPQSPAPVDAVAAAATAAASASAAAAAVSVPDASAVDYDRVLSSSEGRAELEAQASISSAVSLSSALSPGRPVSPPSPSSDSPPPPFTQVASVASDSVPPGEE